jgi:hypothetical protein
MTWSTRRIRSCFQIPWNFVLLDISVSELHSSLWSIYEHTFEGIRIDGRQKLGVPAIISVTTIVSIWLDDSGCYALLLTYLELG